MKIAFLVSHFPSSSETFVLNQITGLIDLGHQVEIYAARRGSMDNIHQSVLDYGLLSVTHYDRNPSDFGIASRKNKAFKARLLLALANALRKHPKSGLSLIRNARRLHPSISTQEICCAALTLAGLGPQHYDIIHCNFGALGLKGMLLREAQLLQGKLITAFHGLDMSRMLQELGDDIYQPLFAQGDYFLPISNHWKERLLSLGCDPKKTSVHRMGVHLQQFCCNPRTPKLGEPLRLLTIARLVEKKGVEYAIRAVTQLLQQGYAVEYCIVGGGPLQNELESLIQQSKVSHAIHMVGWKKQSEVSDLLQQSHVLLAPSVTAQDGDMEGIPVVLMEALATGIPVISTYHSGIPELVQDGRSGYLVAERNIEELANCLMRLCKHPDSLSQMGRLGREIVEQEFNLEINNERLAELYNNLCMTRPDVARV